MSEVWVATVTGLHRVGDGAHELEGRDVVAIGATRGGRWAVADGRSLLRRQPNGDWEEEGTLPDFSARCLLADPKDPRETRLIGTSGAHLFRHGTFRPAVAELGQGYKESHWLLDQAFENAPGREDWYTPWGGPPDVRSIDLDADGTIYVNVHVGGILRLRRVQGSTSGWEPTIEIDSDVHQVLAHDGLVLAACARGLAVSGDGGDSWEFLTAGLHAPYCRAVAVAGDHILLSASTGHDSHRGALYRMPIGGTAFTQCGNGLPDWFDANIDTFWVAGDGAAAAVASSDGRVFVSDDEGGSWALAGEGLPRIHAVSFL